MNHQQLFRKTTLATVLASAGLLLGSAVVTAQAADTADANAATQASEPADAARKDQSAVPGEYVTAQTSNQILADDLLDMDVKNKDDKDKKVGKISDVILDRDGHVSGVVVGVGGFLGVGEKDVGMPWDRIEDIDAKDKVVHVNASKDELKDAPEFKDKSEQKKDKKDDKKRDEAARDSAGTDARAGYYVLDQDSDQIMADKLIGMEVENEGDDDDKVGKISDIILDMDGKVSGVLVGVGGFLGIGEKNVGMPWDRVQRIDTDDKVVRVNVTKDELKDAPDYKETKDSKGK